MEELKINQAVWYLGKCYKISGIKTLTHQTKEITAIGGYGILEETKILYVDLAGLTDSSTLYCDIDPSTISLTAPETEDERVIRKVREAFWKTNWQSNVNSLESCIEALICALEAHQTSSS